MTVTTRQAIEILEGEVVQEWPSVRLLVHTLEYHLYAGTKKTDGFTQFKQAYPASIYECEKCEISFMYGDIRAFHYCPGCGRKVKWYAEA